MSYTAETHNSISLGSRAFVHGASAGLGDSTNMILDASGEKLGIIYYPSKTSPITAVDIRLNIVGAPGNFKIGIFADTSRVPDDATQLGGYTSSFAAPAADGWTGLKTLGSNTGNLTVNTPVWIVIEYVDGTLDGSNYIQLQYSGTLTNRDMQRHHNGTNWTTTTALTNMGFYIVKHADNTYGGFPPSAAYGVSGQPDIYVNSGNVQTQGARYKYGSMLTIVGVEYILTKNGTPNDLTFSIYEGDSLKGSHSELAGNVVSLARAITWLPTPITVAADTYIYILLTQTGTSDSNDYDLWAFKLVEAYVGAIAQADNRFVYGTGTTPSSLTVSTTLVALMYPVIVDTATDLDQAAGGSSPRFGDMTGGLK